MLSEEEKKAIERLNEILKEWQEIVNIEDKTEREIEMSLYMEEMPFEETKTVLNLITKLQKENELAKEQLKKQCEIADERNDLLVKIQELQKQIDLMAEEIRKTILIVKPESKFCQYEEDCKNIRCKDCIKQYFEKQAKENEGNNDNN